MADDVQRISGLVNGSKVLAAARLNNFRTGKHAPLKAHIDWINDELRKALSTSPNPWVDIIAYASRKGSNSGYDNQALSERRRAAVHGAVHEAVPRAGLIKQSKAHGASKSGGDANDNDGYWRAVEVYAYGSMPDNTEPEIKPPPPPPQPKPNPVPVPEANWWITNLSVSGLEVVFTVGGGFADGTITFEDIAGGAVVTNNIRMGGIAVGASVGLDKIPKLGEIIGKNPLVKKFVDWVLNSTSGGKADWYAQAVGPVWPMPGHAPLTAGHFKGTCFTIFINAAAGPGNGGFYVMFLGRQESLAAFLAKLAGTLAFPPAALPALVGNIISNSRAIAVFPAVSLGVGLSVGATGSAYVGRVF